jgi:transposase
MGKEILFYVAVIVGRWRIESAFNRLKDFRRIATRYDRLARNYLAFVCLAAALVWWV